MPATASSATASPVAIATFRPRRGSPGFLLSSLRPIATGTKTMHASANQTIPRIAFTPPAKVSTRTAMSKTRESAASAATRPRARSRRAHRRTSCSKPGSAQLPLRDAARERRVDEEEVVVAGGLHRAVRRGEDGERGEDDERDASPPGGAAAADELVCAEEHHEERAERDAPVDVRPDDEEREGEPDAPRRVRAWVARSQRSPV